MVRAALHRELETGADIGRWAVIIGALQNSYVKPNHENTNIVAEGTLEKKKTLCPSTTSAM